MTFLFAIISALGGCVVIAGPMLSAQRARTIEVSFGEEEFQAVQITQLLTEEK